MDKVEYLKKYQQARRRFDEIMQKLLLLQDERQTITGTLGGSEIHSTDVKSRVETLALNISDKQ